MKKAKSALSHKAREVAHIPPPWGVHLLHDAPIGSNRRSPVSKGGDSCTLRSTQHSPACLAIGALIVREEPASPDDIEYLSRK